MQVLCRIGRLLFYCVLATLCITSNALDVLSEDHDAEVPDAITEENDVHEEMSKIPDSGLPSMSDTADEELLEEIQQLRGINQDHEVQLSEGEEAGEMDSVEEYQDSPPEGGSFAEEDQALESIADEEESQLREKRSVLNDEDFFDVLSRAIADVASDNALFKINGFPRKRCSTFQGPHSHAITHCGNTKTTLGSIKWCKISCGTGYSLVKTTPEYELCGKATKYRWTYQLKGMDRAAEKCTLGHSTFNASVCMTPGCVATAAYYLNKMDFSVNPCDDFYDYSCGRWFKETKIPAAKGHFLTYTVIRDRVNTDVALQLAKPITANEGSAVTKAKIAYKACMDTVTINRLDSTPLLNFLKGDLVWPIIEPSWTTSDFDLEATLATLRRRYNNQVLTKILAKRTAGTHILELWKGKMALPFSYYLDSEHETKLNAYYSLFRDVAVMLGADRNMANRDVADVKAFEKKLAYHKMYDMDYFSLKTIDELADELSGIDWLRLFKLMIKSHPINGYTMVEVWNTPFLENMIKLIQNTDKRTVQNYMVWRIVKHRILNLSKRFMNRYAKYKRVMYGTTVLETREYKCSNQLIFTMKGPTGKLFIDKYFTPAKKRVANILFNNIRKGFLQLLQTEVNWMDAKTKDYAKRKALAIKANFGYNPRYYKNITYIDNELKDLVVSAKDYFGNTVRTLTQIAQNKFAKIGKHYNKHVYSFITSPTTVNAFYSPRYNQITMPAGELQYPFYWGDQFPQMFQYGAVGTILGHELTHAFDNTGRKYGIHGQLYQWWSPKSLNEFNKRTQCMANQYDKYFWRIAGSYLDGHKTLGENIADNGGIRESYAGYHIWLKSQNLTGEELEPSTGLTNNQMFFIGFANVRCGKYNHAGAVSIKVRDVHSPGRFRVIGSLQNFDKFSDAFKCPLGSRMNPKHKCVIW